MSVALVYEPRGYSPIATQSFFKLYWMPGIKALSLEWLPLFECGAPVTANDISKIQEELQLFKDWAKANYNKDSFLFIEERIDLLNEHFGKIDWELNGKIFIG